MKIIISCLTKFHAFNLAEQINKNKSLQCFYTSYAYQKNLIFRFFTKRIDKENIPKSKIRTNIIISALVKTLNFDYFIVQIFDLWVSTMLRFQPKFDFFIGWSSMSLKSMKVAKSKGAIVILERGSSHILFQEKILRKEYKKFKKKFRINKKIIKKELAEYDQADFISIPSNFVKNTFIEYGVPDNKLLLNHYGYSQFFKKQTVRKSDNIYRIVYLGTISIRKGLQYFFEAIEKLSIPKNKYEIHLVGSVDKEFNSILNNFKLENCNFHGHKNHYELSDILSKFDIAVHPSLEEGMSMVTLQLLALGIPVIATTNTGAEDLIKDGFNGYIIDIRNSNQIKEKLEFLYNNEKALIEMKNNSLISFTNNFSWDDYGKRYVDNLTKNKR